MNNTTHNGKIGRLPKLIRDELNRRLDDGEPGEHILEWLNGLPQVKPVLAKDFGSGGRINAQNLSNWRKGGHQEWLKQQERRALVRGLIENAEELAVDARGVEIANHLSAVLVAELAAAARGALAELAEPAERCVRLQEFLLTLTRVRRQDSAAGKLAIERECRAREMIKEDEEDESRKQWAKEWEPFRLQFKRSHMADLFAQPDLASQAVANQDAESLLRGVKFEDTCPPGSATPIDSRSN